MMQVARTRRRLTWVVLVPVVIYLVLSAALIVALTTQLDQATVELTREAAEAVGLEDVSIDLQLLERAQTGILVLGALGIFFASGMALTFHLLSKRHRNLLAETFRKALEGDPFEEEGTCEDDFAGANGESRALNFDGSLGSVQSLGRALRQRQRDSSVSRSRLQRLTQLMDVGVVLFDAERRPELASATALRFLGERSQLPSDEIVEKIFNAFEEEHGRLPDQAVVELDLPGADGIKHVKIQLYHLDESCDHGFLLLVRDRRVLEALDTDLRLAAQSRALSRLYLGVAHDLKAPLNAMGLNLALLRSSLQDERAGDEARRRHWVEVVEQEMTRLQREVERLLAQTAPSREEVEEYDPGKVLEDVQALLAPQGRQLGVKIGIDRPAEPVRVRGRQDLVKQALLNVAINALEAAPKESEVRLELQNRDGRVLIRVCDQGSGISEEDREHIFEIHFTTKEHGTGIGLYIAQSVLESEGGTLILRDSSSAGTVLEATLPTA